jgi:hypothetical protein
MTIVIEYYIPEKFRKQAENGFRQSSAGRSFCFLHRKEAGMRLRSRVRYMRRARIRCFVSRLRNGKEQKSLKVNLQ